jgi:hypothetical protein
LRVEATRLAATTQGWADALQQFRRAAKQLGDLETYASILERQAAAALAALPAAVTAAAPSAATH